MKSNKIEAVNEEWRSNEERPASAECIFYLKVPPENSNVVFSVSLLYKYKYLWTSGWKIIISFTALLLLGFGRWVAWRLSNMRFLICSRCYYSSVEPISLVAPLNLEKLTCSMLKCQFLLFFNTKYHCRTLPLIHSHTFSLYVSEEIFHWLHWQFFLPVNFISENLPWR